MTVKLFKKSLILQGVILSFINFALSQNILPPYATLPQGQEPYPANPVGMQTYINKTIPNIAFVFDNSITMEIAMKDRTLPANRRPRRIDVVKDALLQIVDQYHDNFNFSYANITDYARDLHWKIDPSQPTGYDFSPYHGTSEIEAYSRNTYNWAPTRTVLNRVRKQRTPGTGYAMRSASSRTIDLIKAPDVESSFYNNRNRTFVGGVHMYEEALPSPSSTRDGWGRVLSLSLKRKIGLSLLVPLQNRYSPNYDSANHKQALDLAIRTTGLRTSYLQDIYPNYVEYMANKIQYRCQDTYMIVITDGNTLTNSYNRQAAQKYFSVNKTPDTRRKIGLRPKPSTERDGDGYFYNQSDFSEQNIRSYAIGIGTNPSKFRRFENYGGGKAATATYPEDVKEIFEEFMRDMQLSNIFSMTSPAGSFLYTSDSTSMLVANINTETRGWVAQLRFTKSFNASNSDEDATEMAKYIPNYAVYAASTPKGLINFSDTATASRQLTHRELNLNNNISINSYLKWLTAYTTSSKEIDHETQETYDVFQGDTLPELASFRVRSADALSENRYLGDVLSNSLEMIGPVDRLISAPRYLTVGSNDGTLKIYKSNPDYNKYIETIKMPIYDDEDDDKIIGTDVIDVYDTDPYIFSFAYIPGTAQKNNGMTVLQSLALRAAPGYSTIPAIPHQYNVNGEIAFRTTDKGHTFLVSTLGQGGKGAFALNISGTDHITGQPIGLDTNKNQWATSVPLWDTSNDQFGHAYQGSENLGYIAGKAVIGRIALNRNAAKLPNLTSNVRYATVLASGAYGNQKNVSGPTIYIYDALGIDVGTQAVNLNTNRQPGRLIQKITYKFTEAQKAKFPYINSLSEPTMLDLDGDGVMDVGYVGDLNGNLYRIDLRGPRPSDWSLELVFEGDSSRPILTAPSVSRFFQRTMIIFGTDSLTRGEFTNVNKTQQFLYGIMENKSFTAFKGQPLHYSDSRLLDQKIIRNGNSATISNKTVPWTGFIGWKLPLGNGRDAGEALVQKPIIVNGTIFLQTYIYRENQNPSNSSLMCFRSLDASDTWLYQINALTGGALDENSTYIQQLGRNFSGRRTAGIIDKPVKLIMFNESASVSKDGEMLSGNAIDQALNPKLSSNENFDLADDHYITKENCEAILSNGMSLVCPTEVNNPYSEPLTPGRISIMKIL